MIPLGIDQEGSFFVGTQRNVRGQWICREPQCLLRVVKEPKRIRRQQDQPSPSSEMVREQLVGYFSKEAQKLLLQASRSGLIVHGSHRVRKSQKQNLCVILFSNDCGDATRSQIRELNNKVSNCIFPLSSTEIGRLIGRGPRSVLALQASRKTQSLIDTLRGWASLG